MKTSTDEFSDHAFWPFNESKLLDQQPLDQDDDGNERREVPTEVIHHSKPGHNDRDKKNLEPKPMNLEHKRHINEVGVQSYQEEGVKDNTDPDPNINPHNSNTDPEDPGFDPDDRNSGLEDSLDNDSSDAENYDPKDPDFNPYDDLEEVEPQVFPQQEDINSFKKESKSLISTVSQDLDLNDLDFDIPAIVIQPKTERPAKESPASKNAFTNNDDATFKKPYIPRARIKQQPAVVPSSLDLDFEIPTMVINPKSAAVPVPLEDLDFEIPVMVIQPKVKSVEKNVVRILDPQLNCDREGVN